jgi:hypothetical protein
MQIKNAISLSERNDCAITISFDKDVPLLLKKHPLKIQKQDQKLIVCIETCDAYHLPSDIHILSKEKIFVTIK